MIDIGDVYLADLGGERPDRVLVLSNARFNRAADRVLVAPERRADVLRVRAPWHVEADDAVYAIEHSQTVRPSQLLDHVGRAAYPAMVVARRALLAITS